MTSKADSHCLVGWEGVVVRQDEVGGSGCALEAWYTLVADLVLYG